MSAGPVIRAAAGGVTRRLVQTLMIFVVVAAATATATLGLTLLTSANEAAVNANAVHHGADIAVSVDTSRATDAQLAATRHVPGVTQIAGPYPEATITLQYSASAPGPAGGPVGPPGLGGRPRGRASSLGHGRPKSAGRRLKLASGPPGPGRSWIYSQRTVIGRASTGGPLEDLDVNLGHWLTGPGQIFLPNYEGSPFPAGTKVTVVSAPGKPQLTVVGFGGSPGRFGDGWVVPSELAALRPHGAPTAAQMLYTFTKASSTQQISSDVAALKAALPAGTITSYQSWLDAIGQTGGESAFNTPFVLAFALLGLVLAVLIVASLVSGAVAAGYRRIGVLKSIGFTPLQVAAAYIAQAGAPALAGIVAGAVAGNLWVTPMLNTAAALIGASAQHVPLWIDAAVPAGMCVLVGLAALVPALRAGRLSAVQAIAAGQAPRTGRGYAAHRLAGRLVLPRPVTIGVAAPFTRPARTATTLAAILFGATAVILAAGLNSSLNKIYNNLPSLGQGQVVAGLPKGAARPALTPSQRRMVEAAIRAQPGTLRYVAADDDVPSSVRVTGVTALNPEAYDGGSAWLGWPLISGHWYGAPGEVDVNAEFLTETGLSVGDHLTMTVDGKPVGTRIAGQVYDPNGPSLWTSWQTLGGRAAGLAVTDYRIGLRPGTSPRAYAAALSRALGPRFGVHLASGSAGGTAAQPSALIRLLTELIAVLAGLGVLSSVLMATRERVHDLGIFKAVGMTPWQTLTMVICEVIAPAIIAAVIAIPAAIYVHAVTVQEIGTITGSGMAASAITVYHPAELFLLALSGLAIAAAGALLPASWAAASITTTALRAE